MPQKSTDVAIDARILRSRESLRAALLKLLKRKPLEEISIRDIVAEAGISYTTFFRHHATKDSLLDEIAADEIHHLIAISLPIIDADDSLKACRVLLEYVDQNRALWTTLLTGGAANALRQQFIEESRDITNARPNLRSGLPADLGHVLTASSIVEILRWWLAQKKPMTIKRVADILDQMVVSPTLHMK